MGLAWGSKGKRRTLKKPRLPPRLSLFPRRVEHIFDENSVALGGVVDHYVGDGADQLPVLNDRGARHECGQGGTTVFYKIFIKLAHRLGGGALFLSVLINL